MGLNLRFGGTNPISGVQLPMATACSEETGEEGEIKGFSSTIRAGLSMKSCL